MSHQASVRFALAKNEGPMTKLELYHASTASYYYNWQKHFGNVLSRMVNSGQIVRVKRGVYNLPPKQRGLIKTVKDQQQLF